MIKTRAGSALVSTEAHTTLDCWPPLREQLVSYQRRHGRLPYGVAKELQMAFVSQFEPAPEGIIDLWDVAYHELRALAYNGTPRPALDDFGGLGAPGVSFGSKPPSRMILKKCRVDRLLLRIAAKIIPRLAAPCPKARPSSAGTTAHNAAGAQDQAPSGRR